MKYSNSKSSGQLDFIKINKESGRKRDCEIEKKKTSCNIEFIRLAVYLIRDI